MPHIKNFLIFAFILIAVNAYSYNVTNDPTIDFGSVSYLYGNTSGFNTIAAQDGSGLSTSGSGALYDQIGGSVGTITLGNFGFLQGIQPGVEMFSGPFEVQTSGCGKITITNLTTTNGDTSDEKWRGFSSTLDFPLGGTLTFNEITATAPCYIQGTISNAYRHRPSGLGSWTNASIKVKVYVVPHMALVHDDNASLNFGTICSAPHQQTITIAPNGAVSPTNLFCSAQNTSADTFTITGNNGQTFNVDLPSSVVITSGSNSLNVTNLTPSCLNNCALSGNTYSLGVGGTLTVPANAPLGDYQGNYQLRITY
ncbi:MAG: DUF4402 domain-containing protein [Elusimicrobiaceae bacterium]|nr:DUF4402 domain-containing protein [Elusimicrobiaceae bacterium]